MPLKLTIVSGTNSAENNQKSPSSLIANHLAGLEYSHFSGNDYTNLRILQFDWNNTHDIELWDYCCTTNSSIPAICLHETLGIIVSGGDSLPLYIQKIKGKPIIWFQDQASSQKQQKGFTCN